MSKRYRIGIFPIHPIQYQVPWFRTLSDRFDMDVTVYYSMIPNATVQGEGFGVDFTWDVPLLSGYRYRVLKNVARNQSPGCFFGCDTPGIYRIVRKGGFDAFIVNGWVVKSCLQLLLACRMHGVPVIVRGESNDMRRRPLWARVLHRLLLRQYAGFLAIGRRNRAFYLKNGVPRKRIFIAPYGVDNQRFITAARALQLERGILRRRFGFDEKAFIFLFCGKFVLKKHPLHLIEGLDLLLKRYPFLQSCTRLLMVGDGLLLPAAKTMARNRNLPVVFTGFLNQREIVKAYVAADCLLLPSDTGETWGLVVNEAMACGLPAIVSDQVGCGPDLVIDGQTGYTYPFGDIGALADRMADMVDDLKTSAKMGRLARNHVSRYDIDRVTEGISRALRFVCR